MKEYYTSNCGDASCGDPGCVRCAGHSSAAIYVAHENGVCERGCEICAIDEPEDDERGEG